MMYQCESGGLSKENPWCQAGRLSQRPPEAPGSPIEHHCNPGSNELQDELQGVPGVTGHIARIEGVMTPEPRLDSHLQRRGNSAEPCSVHRKPVALLKVEEHG